MSVPDDRPLSEKVVDTDLIQAAMQRAAREAVLMHARLGHPVSTWRDGKVVWLSPEEVFALFPPEETGNKEQSR